MSSGFIDSDTIKWYDDNAFAYTMLQLHTKKPSEASLILRNLWDGFDIIIEVRARESSSSPSNTNMVITAVRSFKHKEDLPLVVPNIRNDLRGRRDAYISFGDRPTVAKLVGDGEWIFLWDSGGDIDALYERSVKVHVTRGEPHYCLDAEGLLNKIFIKEEHLYTPSLSNFIAAIIDKFSAYTENYSPRASKHYASFISPSALPYITHTVPTKHNFALSNPGA